MEPEGIALLWHAADPEPDAHLPPLNVVNFDLKQDPDLTTHNHVSRCTTPWHARSNAFERHSWLTDRVDPKHVLVVVGAVRDCWQDFITC